jgi:anti-sigma regulatory factor (Ser/Thr protein kinase)
MAPPAKSLELRLQSANGTAALARAAVAGMATDLPETAISDAQLLTTEVVANAITHAGLGPSDVITLRITGDGFVRVEVFDPGPMFDAGPRQRKSLSGGLGLVLVDALATSWGIERENNGKHVWFEIRLEGAARG